MKKNRLVSVVIVSKDRRKDLLECVSSYLESAYKPLEIVIVDNGSKPHIVTWLPKSILDKVKLVTLQANVGAAAGRNRGLEKTTGEYILFSDDDAEADNEMVTYLVEAFEGTKNAGIIQPLVYDKQKRNLLQGAGHDINLTTARIKAWGVREIDKGQYEGLRPVPMCGCVWMVNRSVFDKIGGYDEDYFIPYEDSDFSLRVRQAGFGTYCYSKAKTWHQGHKSTYVHPWVEWLGITSPERAYRVVRNKMIFMRKHSPFPRNLLFFFILMPVYTLIHSLIILASGKFDVLFKYWLGVLSGIIYALSYPFRKPFIDSYKKFDRNMYPFKLALMAWTDPLLFVIDKSGRTILDLACGQGKPMQMIKARMKVEKAVGVDLFEPYIKQAKKEQIHDQYVIQDIRKVNFKPKSFDIVLASHVLEHLKVEDAWKVLENMERMAKKQVIIATPIGEHYHPAEDGNILQLHVSAFTPEDFIDRGYKIKKYGWKWLLGDHGLVHSVKNDILRKFLYGFNILMTPVYYLFQSSCDYVFVAYKKTEGID